jgi:fumarate hydratase class II
MIQQESEVSNGGRTVVGAGLNAKREFTQKGGHSLKF